MALTLRPTTSDRSSERYQVHSGEVRIGTIYHTDTRPDGKQWFWGINGVLHGPARFQRLRHDAGRCRRELDDSWGKWLAAAKLSELEGAVPHEDGESA